MNTFLAWLEIPARTTQLGATQGPDLTRYFTVLGILLAAILALAFGFKKLFAGAMRAKAAKRHLAIVDLLPLGGKQRLAVVRCYDRTFALGLGDKEVALIAELDSVHAEGRGLETPGPAERVEFASLLQRLQSRLGGTSSNAASNDAPVASTAPAAEARKGSTVSERLAAVPEPVHPPAAKAASTASRGTSAERASVGKHVRELLGSSGVLG
ncbi:MAG: flagellar biosynthetic protein FliO [Planctomycetes bacterium]|nr:flagellar biosynthetic protein FliO [Planctomycetota bacterium]